MVRLCLFGIELGCGVKKTLCVPDSLEQVWDKRDKQAHLGLRRWKKMPEQDANWKKKIQDGNTKASPVSEPVRSVREALLRPPSPGAWFVIPILTHDKGVGGYS